MQTKEEIISYACVYDKAREDNRIYDKQARTMLSLCVVFHLLFFQIYIIFIKRIK